MKRLYRRKDDRMIAGVCSGVAEYFNLDPTLVRLAWAALVLFGGFGIPAYLLGAVIIPENENEYRIEGNIIEKIN